MIRYICNKKQLNCLIPCLFKEITLPCEHCIDNIKNLIITGKTHAGNEATIEITDYGFIFSGNQKDVEVLLRKDCQNEKKSKTI